MRGKGVPKMFFFDLFWLCLGFRVGSKKLVPIFYIFWAQFWIPIFWDLGFFGCLLGAFFGLLRLSWEAFVVKNIKKTHCFFDVFWECCFLGFWCLWWLFWVICFSLWAVFIHHGFQNGIRKGSKQWSSIKQQISLKMSRKWDQKWVPAGGLFEIAGLRHFLPSKHFLWFFLVDFCMAFWSSLGVSWAALGFPEGLLEGLWTQKH